MHIHIHDNVTTHQVQDVSSQRLWKDKDMKYGCTFSTIELSRVELYGF